MTRAACAPQLLSMLAHQRLRPVTFQCWRHGLYGGMQACLPGSALAPLRPCTTAPACCMCQQAVLAHVQRKVWLPWAAAEGVI